MRWSPALVVSVTVIMVVSGVAFLATHGSSPPAGGAYVASALTTDAVAVPSDASARPMPPSTPVALTLTLVNPNRVSLDRFLSAVEDPSSPSYRHFVTFPQFVARFSPPESSVQTVESSLVAAGGQDVSAAPDRSYVSAVLPARSVDQLFGVSLVTFGRSAGLDLYTAVGSVVLPAPLHGLVSGIGGLSDRATVELAAQMMDRSAAVQPLASGPSQFVSDPALGENWFIGSDYTQAYDATQLFPGPGSVAGATYPTSVAIATLLVSSFNQSLGSNLPPWDPVVIDAYFNSTFPSNWPTPTLTGVPVAAGGVTPPPPGSFGGENDTTEYELENSLDLEMAGSLAPGAALYNFYFGASLLTASTTAGDAADYLAADLSEALSYSYAPAHLAVVSCSFGLPDLNDSAWNVELQTAAATGVTIVSASGDQGNAPDSLTGRPDGQWPIWPADAATNTTGAVSVGGVTINLSGAPTSAYNGTSLNLSYDSNIGHLTGVSGWWDTTGGPGQYGGSEGGISPVYAEPWWQFDSAAEPAIVNATLVQGASSLGRAGPDVAMPANSTIATVSANATGEIFFTVLEGTSIAAPVFAGLLADVVAVENNRSGGAWAGLGFIDPEIYSMASFFEVFPALGTDPFEDVTVGNNYVFSAGPGWDALTGWGEVSAPAFLAADLNSTVRGYAYTGPTPGLPPVTPSSGASIPWTLIFVIFGLGIVVAVLLVIFAARPSRPKSMVNGVPPGAQWGAPNYSGPVGTLPGATFLCPYCGAIRPAEPVRCPQCGTL